MKKNHFQKFSLSAQFDINLEELERKYLELQSQFHPDKSNSTDLGESIAINEAYQILSDEFSRACYLLLLAGIDLKHDEKAVKPNISTLTEVLELQERITEITDEKAAKQLKQNLTSQVGQLIQQAMKCLEVNQTELAAQILVKAKYLKKSLEDLKSKKKQLQ